MVLRKAFENINLNQTTNISPCPDGDCLAGYLTGYHIWLMTWMLPANKQTKSKDFADDFVKLFSKQQILDCSKLKEFTDDNFKFDEIGRKFSKRIENTVFSSNLYHRHVKTRACLGKG